MITKEDIYKSLTKIIDPELGVSIVKLGLIYEVKVEYSAPQNSLVPQTTLTPQTTSASQTTSAVQTSSTQTDEAQVNKPDVLIVMTLTTPGCPLAAVFDPMIRDGLFGIPGLDPDKDVTIQLTFDPPWVPDMMDEETKAELGF